MEFSLFTERFLVLYSEPLIVSTSLSVPRFSTAVISPAIFVVERIAVISSPSKDFATERISSVFKVESSTSFPLMSRIM